MCARTHHEREARSIRTAGIQGPLIRLLVHLKHVLTEWAFPKAGI